MEDDFEEHLFSDLLEEVYTKLKKKIENELRNQPYAIVRLRWLKKELRGRRGIQYIIRRLSREYSVVKMGSWYVIRRKKSEE